MTEKHFTDKTFADCHKNATFAKVFSLESFRLYVRYMYTHCISSIIIMPTFFRDTAKSKGGVVV